MDFYFSRWGSPVGEVIMVADARALRLLHITSEDGKRAFAVDPGWRDKPDHPLLKRARAELEGYFAGELEAFGCPLDPQGTDFQRQVWQALREIGFGQTRTYGQVAAAIGRPGAARAVGGAIGRNPLPILIPCHRVIGQDGRLTGFAHGLSVKRRLLRHETPALAGGS